MSKLITNVPKNAGSGELLYPAGVVLNTQMPDTRVEAPVEISLETVRQDVEQLLLRQHAKFPHSDYSLMEISSDGTFIYNFTDEQGRLTSFKARWSTEYGYVTVDWTGQTVFETNAGGEPLYPAGIPMNEADGFDYPQEFLNLNPTPEEKANWRRSQQIIDEYHNANVKLPREYQEDDVSGAGEPLLPNLEQF